MEFVYLDNPEVDCAVNRMMDRIRDIEIAYSWEAPWTDVINEWGLSYEVYWSSGLTPELIKNLSNEEFINKVSEGMLEWDI